MKQKILFLILSLLVPLNASAKLKVVTTISDLAALTQEIGGEFVEVKSIARGDQDPHYLEPKPSYAVLLSRADLLIEVGLQLETGWLPVLLTQSRNPKVQFGQPGHLSAAEGVAILEIPTGRIDRSMGDIHPEGNPHYWLNPQNGLVIASQIAQRLAQIDSAHAFDYQNNYRQFESRLKHKISEWEKKLVALKGKKIITHHKSFSYFVDWAGLQVMGLIEPKPGIPPSPGHILSLINLIEKEKIPLVITENYYDPKPSQKLAAKTGIKVLILPTSVGGEGDIKTYSELFDALIQRLAEVL